MTAELAAQKFSSSNRTGLGLANKPLSAFNLRVAVEPNLANKPLSAFNLRVAVEPNLHVPGQILVREVIWFLSSCIATSHNGSLVVRIQ